MSVLATSLPVEVRRTADGQSYQFGVNINGAFVVFGTRKTGGVDDQIALAAEQAAVITPVAPSIPPVTAV